MVVITKMQRLINGSRNDINSVGCETNRSSIAAFAKNNKYLVTTILSDVPDRLGEEINYICRDDHTGVDIDSAVRIDIRKS